MRKVLTMLLAGAMIFTIGGGMQYIGNTTADTEDLAEKTPDNNAANIHTQAIKINPPKSKKEKKLVIGFVQVGSESDWRIAFTNSIKEEAERRGIELRFADAQQKQENQITALHTFIVQKVDVIGISPVVETGWETVFQEVKEAGIPIILVDRSADVSENLYVTRIGSDFKEEGNKAAEEMAAILGGKGNVAEITGTVGSAAATERLEGFREVIEAKYPKMKIVKSQSGDFTRARGKEVMESFFKSEGKNIQGLYAHNDDMAIGAIQAIEEYGLKPGKDIKIVSIDGVRGAFEAMSEGKLNATVECNPLLGPQFFDTCEKVVKGEKLAKYIPSEEGVYTQEIAKAVLPSRQY